MFRTHIAGRFCPSTGLIPALLIGLTALAAPGVRAQQPAAQPTVTAQPALFPLNQPMVFGYADAQGTGSLTLTDVGADPATGGRELLVSITKNGVRADGSGLSYLLTDLPPALNNLITFSVVVPNGPAYFYQGKMGGTAQFQGQGTFHTVADPTQIAGWSLFALPALTVDRTQINFPAQHLGQTSPPLCFTLTNPGPQPVFITNVSIQNCSSDIDPQFIDCTHVAGFQIVSGGTPVILAPGQSQSVCITITPTEISTVDAHVMISTNVSPIPVQVNLHAGGVQ
jgi:hypothetical protein